MADNFNDFLRRFGEYIVLTPPAEDAAPPPQSLGAGLAAGKGMNNPRAFNPRESERRVLQQAGLMDAPPPDADAPLPPEIPRPSAPASSTMTPSPPPATTITPRPVIDPLRPQAPSAPDVETVVTEMRMPPVVADRLVMSDAEERGSKCSSGLFGRGIDGVVIAETNRLLGNEARRRGGAIEQGAIALREGITPAAVSEGSRTAERIPGFREWLDETRTARSANPFLQPPADMVGGLKQPEREALSAYIAYESIAPREERGAAVREAGIARARKADETDPLFLRADQLQMNLAEIRDMPKSARRSAALGNIGGNADFLVADALETAMDSKNEFAKERLDHALRIQRGVRDEMGDHSKSMENAGWFDKMTDGMANMLPLMVKGGALDAIPGIGSLLSSGMWTKQAMGAMAGDVAMHGGNPVEAADGLLAAAVGYALIERLQVKHITKLSQPAMGSFRRRLVTAGLRAGGKVPQEIAEEVGQEIIQDAAVRKALAEQGINLDHVPFMDIVRATFDEAGPGLAGLVLAGAGVGHVRGGIAGMRSGAYAQAGREVRAQKEHAQNLAAMPETGVDNAGDFAQNKDMQGQMQEAARRGRDISNEIGSQKIESAYDGLADEGDAAHQGPQIFNTLRERLGVGRDPNEATPQELRAEEREAAHEKYRQERLDRQSKYKRELREAMGHEDAETPGWPQETQGPAAAQPAGEPAAQPPTEQAPLTAEQKVDILRARVNAREGAIRVVDGDTVRDLDGTERDRRDLLADVAERFGLEVVPVEVDAAGVDTDFNGVFVKDDERLANTIFINAANLQKALNWTIGHELSHSMRESDPDLTRQFTKMVLEGMTGEGLVELARIAKRENLDISADKVMDEFISDRWGDIISDEKMWASLGENRRSAFNSVFGRLLQIINKAYAAAREFAGAEQGRAIGGGPTSQYATNLDKMRKAVYEAIVERSHGLNDGKLAAVGTVFRESGGGARAQTSANAAQGAQFSVRRGDRRQDSAADRRTVDRRQDSRTPIGPVLDRHIDRQRQHVTRFAPERERMMTPKLSADAEANLLKYPEGQRESMRQDKIAEKKETVRESAGLGGLEGYEILPQQMLKDIYEELQASNTPFILEAMDIGNLGGLNAHFKNDHGKADVALRAVIGDIYVNTTNELGGIIGKFGSDEYVTLWVGYNDVGDVRSMRRDIERRMGEERKTQGINNIVYPKRIEGYDGFLNTGALHTAYGLIKGDSTTPFKEARSKAEAIAEYQKKKNLADVSKIQKSVANQKNLRYNKTIGKGETYEHGNTLEETGNTEGVNAGRSGGDNQPALHEGGMGQNKTRGSRGSGLRIPGTRGGVEGENNNVHENSQNRTDSFAASRGEAQADTQGYGDDRGGDRSVHSKEDERHQAHLRRDVTSTESSADQRIADLERELAALKKQLASGEPQSAPAAPEPARPPRRVQSTPKDRRVSPSDRAARIARDARIQFSRRENVETTAPGPQPADRNLVALHNLTQPELLRTIRLGGFPMPSIAVMKKDMPHDRYGDTTVIFGRETIDPAASRDNRVHGGDAWTPTFPQIGHKLNPQMIPRLRGRILNRLQSEGLAELGRTLALDSVNLQNTLNSGGQEGIASHYRREPGMMAAFLLERGESVDQVMTEKRYGKYDNEVYERIISEIPEAARAWNELDAKGRDRLEPRIRKIMHDYFVGAGKDRRAAIYEKPLDFNLMDGILEGVFYYNRGGAGQEIDTVETEGALRKRIEDNPELAREYGAWLEEVFAGAVEKSGVRNSKGFFTNMGNRRDWEVLHDEVTLENIVRAMRSEKPKANNSFVPGLSTVVAAGTEDFKSVDAIRKGSDRLRHMDEADYDKLNEEYKNRLLGLIERMNEGGRLRSFDALGDASEAVADMAAAYARNPRTAPTAIIRRLTEFEQYAESKIENKPKLEKDIGRLLFKLKSMPTEYFEAKPRCAVRLDEIKGVIVPENTNEQLKTALESNSIPYVTYDPAKPGARAEKTRAYVEDRGVAFSRRFGRADEAGIPDGHRERFPKSVPAARKQWAEKGVRSSFFKRWFGDWVKDPENASKVVDENGEPLVVYHGGAKDFNVFDPNKGAMGSAFWFTADKAEAQDYANGRVKGGGVIKEAYLSIKNPADWDLYDRYGLQQLREKGFDGVILSEDGSPTNYIAFSPNQIKSATDNRGTFDGANPDIRFSRREGSTRQDVQTKLNNLLAERGTRDGQGVKMVLKNADDGTEVNLTRTSIRKMTSDDAVKLSVKRGFSREEHFGVVSDIINLYEKSLKVAEHPDEGGNPDLAAVHRYAAPTNVRDGSIALITVKESTQHGKLLYSVEGIEIRKPGGLTKELSDKFTHHASLRPSFRLYDNNIRKLESKVNTQPKNNSDVAFSRRFGRADEAGIPDGHRERFPKSVPAARKQWAEKGVRSSFFKRWFGDWVKDPENASKVVNENGEPLVVYHGARTLEDFTVFRPGKIFFVNNRDVAEMFRSDHAYKLIVDGEEHGISESTANDIKAVLEPHEDLEWATGWNLLEDTGKTTEDFNELIEDGALQTGLDSFDGAKEIRIERNNASLYEAYLNIRNPKIIDAGGRGWTGDMEHNEWIFDGGHDGIIVKNIVEGGLAAEMPDGSEPPPATNYIVKNSNQIKSATDNRGTFDGANPDIRFSRRGGAGNNYITPSGRDVSQAGASGERMSTEIDGWDGVANLPSMEEARRSVQHSHRVHLEKIWDAAIKNKGDHPYSLGSPTPRLLEEIGRVLGRKVNAKHQIITLGYTRHINKSHGVGGRSVAGQVPVTRERFSLIPDVLKNFDTVEVGHETRGGDGVLIRKRYADGEAVLVDVVPVKGNLEIRSYRIDKASGRGRQLSNYVSQADVSPDYTSETHRDTPATTNNLPHSPPKVNTLPENNSDVAFSERYDLTTDQYRERDRDPRWAVAAAVQGILADEGITLPGWGGELSASPGPAGLFTFAGAVQNWGRARTDEGRKKWARAEERLMDWVHEHPDVVAAAGFSEALDTTFGRDDRFNLRDLVDAIPEWLADFNAGRFQPGDGEINTNNPDGASSQIDRIEADVRGEGGAGSASGSDASGGLRARFDATPTVWVSGKEMFDFAEPLDMRAIRTKTIEWMAEQGYFRNDYKNADAGWDNIHITARGANNSLQHGAGPEKIQSFAALPRVIKSGVLIKTKPGKSHQSDMKEHIFAAKLDIGNKPMLVGFVIKEDSNGKRFYDHEMTSIISLGEVPSQVGADGPNTQNAVRPRQGSILNILKESLGVNILNENNYNQNANVPKSRPWNEEERGSWREDEWDEWERRQRWERDIRRDVRREERKKKKEQEQEQESRQKKMRRDLREEIREGNKERKRARSARVQEQRRQRREADAFVDEALRAVRAQDRARSSRSSSVDQQAHAEIDAFLRETMGVDDRMVRDFRRARMIIERRATLNEIDYNSLNLSETQKAQYKEWVDGQPGSEMPQAILDRYDELYNAVVAGRTADEIAQLRDKLKSITAAGRVRVSLNRMLELMDRSEQVHEMLKQVGAIFGRDPTPEEKKAGKFRVDIRYVHHQKADDRDKGAVTRVRQSLKEWAVEIDYESLSPETIIRIWDGSMGKSDEAIESSPFFKNIFGKILNCWTARLTNLERATERFNECMRPIAGLMDKKAEKEFREDLEFLEKKPAGPERDKAIRKLHEKRDRAIGKFINDKRSQVLVTVPIEDRAGATSDKKITIDEAMFVYAHSQNEDGRTHLRGALDDDGERVGGSYGSGYYPSMDAIIDALPEEFKQAVDNVIDYFDNEQYPRVNPVFAREHLIDMLKSDRYVPMRNLEMEGKSIAEVLKMEDSLRRASLKKGATKGRVGSDLAFANPSFFGTVIPAIREVEHYIAFNDAVRDINGLLGDDNLRRALEQKHPEGLRMVEEWIVDTASDKTPPPKDVISKFAAKLKGLYTVGVLGFNFLTTVKQLDSWTQGMARISGGWWRVPSVLLRAPSQFHSVWALAQNNSVMMRHRARDIERGLTEMAGHPDFTREIELRLGKRGIEIDVAGAVAMWRQAAMWTIQTADMIVTTSLWVAKFESRFNELYALQRKKGMPEEEARDWARKAASVSADALIRRTQPMFDKVVAPKSLRSGNPLVRMFGMFINQQNKNWNNLHDTLMGLHNRGLLKTAILGAMTHVVPGIIFYTLSSGRVSLDTGDDEWEDAWKAMWRSDWGDAAQRAAGAAENYNILNNPLNPLKWNVPIEEWIDTMAENNFAGVPGFGLIPIAAVRAGTNYIRVARGRAANWSPAVSLSPVTDMASKGVGLARNAGRQAIEKDLMDAAKLGSQAAGLPAWIQANRIINALEAEDWRRLIWSRNALKDKGVFANMALMANGQVGAVDPKTGKWKDGPFDKFLRWYRDLDRPEQERFDRYYNNVLDEKADEDQESEYKLVRAYDGSENPLQRRWAKNRQALWGVEGRRSYDEWEDKQATDREGRMDAKEAANQFLEKVISNRGSVTTK